MVRLIQIIVGTILVVMGVIITPLPPPFAFGIPMLLVGLALLAPHAPFIQNWIRKARGKSAKLDTMMVTHRDKLPGFVKTTIDQTTPPPTTPSL